MSLTARLKEELEAEYMCTYRGFVHTATNDNAVVPKIEALQKAFKMLDKKNVKKTQKIHPLFGRGFDTPLLMQMFTSALRVSIPKGDDDKKGPVIMNTQLHKIAYIGAVGNGLGVIVKRPGVGKFKAHIFMFKNAAECQQALKSAVTTTNKAFKMLNTVSRKLRARRIRQGAPPTVARRAPSLADEEQPWFHGPMGRADAERILLNFDAINGLFLVRQREGKKREFVLSFVFEGEVYHNKVEKTKGGDVVNSKGTSFPDLRTMVAIYQNKHPDMQVILTEYVPRGAEDSGGADYANAVMINELRDMKLKQKKEAGDEDGDGSKPSGLTKWSTVDIQSALSELDAEYDNGDYNDGADPDYEEVSEDTIDFNPIYDDLRFGFGNDFVSVVMTGSAEQPSVEEDVDLNNTELFDISTLMQLDGMEEC